MSTRKPRARRFADTATLSLFDQAAAPESSGSAAPRDAPALGDALDAAQAALAEGFADHVVRWAEQQGAASTTLGLLRSAAHAVSVATASGHACIHLDELASTAGSVDALRAALLASRVVAPAGAPGGAPLVLDRDARLYLHRYFDYERRIAKRLLRCRRPVLDDAMERRLAARLDALFASNRDLLEGAVDWQKLAAALAIVNAFTVISGGPGTGKTTTVVNLLACLLELEPDCRIAIAAPTGKAAARMQEAVRRRAADLPAHIRQRLSHESFTVHRLLGVTPGTTAFVHHAANPLPYDVVVVDEASMLDVALAAKLFDAVPPSARIVLLGDKDQLAAVESGAVFSELSADPSLGDAVVTQLARICAVAPEQIVTPAPGGPTVLRDTVVWLTGSFRFRADSGIGRLARLVNAGEAAGTLAWLRAADDPSVRWLEHDARMLDGESMRALVDGYAAYREALQRDARDANAVLDAFDRHRILCAQRESARGARAINDVLGRTLREAIEHTFPSAPHSPWYCGRPVMVLRNDYVLKLYNGDIGIALPDDAGNLLVHFRDTGGSVRAIAPMRLPEHETAFASTVHKAQGSEFDDVALVLPARASRVVTRELLYTAVTRARRRVTLIGGSDVLQGAIESRTLRHSGLIARLREIGELPVSPEPRGDVRQ